VGALIGWLPRPLAGYFAVGVIVFARQLRRGV
jgi:hypothetical protein